MQFAPVTEAIKAVGQGGMAVVVDDANRENEGDLIMAAEAATPEAIGFIVRHSSGIICAPLTAERVTELRLPPMCSENTDTLRTAFTVSVDARFGTTTGISAADRSLTLRALADAAAGPESFTRPGHVFPLRAMPAGVLGRPGHTEAAQDLAALAGLRPAGVLCELVNDDGSMARLPQLSGFADRHRLPIISIGDLIAHRRQTETLVARLSEARLPTRYGVFTAITFQEVLTGLQHVALTLGAVTSAENPLVRVHSECLTGEAFGSLRCDCGAQLDLAMATIARAGQGCIVYLRGQEGRGGGLAHKMRAYALQDQGLDTVQADIALSMPIDSRDYTMGAQILADLGVTTLRLMTNNPGKYAGIRAFGLEITARVPLLTTPNPENLVYLRAKQEKLGHALHDSGATQPAESWKAV